MKRMTKILGVSAACVLGAALSGSVAYASSPYVQALLGKSAVYANGQHVADPPKLVYGGTTYVQLYSIQLGLQSAGIQSRWDGYNFTFNTPQASSMTKTQFVQNVKSVGNTLVDVLQDRATHMQSYSSQNAQDLINSEIQHQQTLTNLQQQVANWNVSDPAEQHIKSLIIQWIDTDIVASKFLQDTAQADEAGDTTTATNSFSAFNSLQDIENNILGDIATSLHNFDPADFPGQLNLVKKAPSKSMLKGLVGRN